jgi:hypothetical protein
MEKKTRYIVLGASAVVAVSGIIAMIVTSNKKKKEVSDILNKLSTGAGATGTIADLTSDDAFNINLLSSGKIPAGAKIFTVAAAQSYAKKLNGLLDQYGGVYDDEEGAIAALSQIGTKAKVSQVAKEFGKLYGKNLGDFLTSKIDKANNPTVFKQTINNMKLY